MYAPDMQEKTIVQEVKGLESKFEIAYTGTEGYSNKKVINEYFTWDEICEVLEYVEKGEKDGPYFLRGPCFKKPGTRHHRGFRRNNNMTEKCTLLICDCDSTLGSDGKTIVDGKGAPDPELVHEALKEMDWTYCIYTSHSNQTEGYGFRYRIVFPTAGYGEDQLAPLTDYITGLLHEREIFVKNVTENKTLSQAWYFPRCDDVEKFRFFRHDGELLNVCGLDLSVNQAVYDYEPKTSDHNPMKKFIGELESGTIHAAAKSYAGWKVKTSDLTMNQIFDELDALIDFSCSDKEKAERWHDGERTALEKWFREQDFSKGNIEEIKEGTTIDDLMAEIEAEDEDIEKIGKEKWLYPNLIQKNYITVIIAEAGGGKTTFLLKEVCPYMAKHGSNIFYVDADSPPTDYKHMKTIAERNNFKLILPEFNQGLSIKDFIAKLQAMRKAKLDLTNTVFVFDTLKKFADLMSKNDVKEIFSLCRSLNAQGATTILCAHANKKRDKQDHLIPEGVGDVKNDTDTLLFFERNPVPAENGGINVTTVCDMGKGAKVRGQYEPFSFNISKQREVLLLDETLEVMERGRFRKQDDTSEEDILKVAEDLIKEVGQYHQLLKKDIVWSIYKRTTASQRRVQDIITQNSKKEGENKIRRLTYRSAKHNRKVYGSTPQEIKQHKKDLFDYQDPTDIPKYIRKLKSKWDL